MNPKKYYPHVDGIRFFAVLLVILFHFNKELFPYGYLGVDIFFVISGFVITKLIYSELEVKKFNLINFYIRRFKRIMPALIFMILTCSIAYLYFSFPGDSVNFLYSLKTAIYSLFGISNLFLLFTGSQYFIEKNPNPFLHTWSLGVEEQFYLVWPALLMTFFFFFPKKKSVFLIHALLLIIIIIIINLASNEQNPISGQNILKNFYSPIFHSFELVIGSILFFIRSAPLLSITPLPTSLFFFNRNQTFYFWNKKFIIFLFTDLAKLQSKNFKNLSIVGISLIFFLDLSKTLFFNAFIACIGVSLIILDSNNSSFFNKILKNRYIVYLGKISYSLYLWHLPIIILSLNYFNNINYYIFCSLLILLISSISYHLIEKPIRETQNYYNIIKKILIIYLILLITLVAGLQLGYAKKFINKSLFFLHKSNFNYFTIKFGNNLNQINLNNVPFFSIHGNCQIDWNSYFLNQRNNLANIPLEKWTEKLLNSQNKCFYKKNSKKIIFLIGDSGATALASIADIHGYDLAILTKGGWIFSNNVSAVDSAQFSSRNFSRIKEESIYVDRIVKIFNNLSKNYDKSYILISSRYDSYLSNKYNLYLFDNENNPNYYELKNTNDILPENILKLINKFENKPKIIFINNTPRYKYTFEECYMKLYHNLIKNCNSYPNENSDLEKSSRLLEKLKDSNKDIYIYNFNGTVCKNKICNFFFKKNQSFVIDTIHLNPITSIDLQSSFKIFIDKIN
jgi:peptidoglycan/LPS O-acetylase OafA/YrhL